MKKGVVHIAVQMVMIVSVALLLSGFVKPEKQPITSLDLLAQPGVRIAVGLDTPAEASLRPVCYSIPPCRRVSDTPIFSLLR